MPIRNLIAGVRKALPSVLAETYAPQYSVIACKAACTQALPGAYGVGLAYNPIEPHR